MGDHKPINMKYLRVHSHDSRSKTLKSIYSIPKRNSSFNEKPTPLDFDSFIPWFCLELQVAKNVVVTRTNQADYVRYDSKTSKGSSTRSTKSKSRSTKLKLSTIHSGTEEKKVSSLPKISFATSTVDIQDAIPVTTCYDRRGRLVEIAIVGCPFEIPRKVIQAFNLCLPFHSGLSKLSIRKGGLCPIILYEICKLLPHSNITEVCLDDSRVPEGSYSIILDRPSQIKYLSLKRCGIDDEECKNLAAKLVLKGPVANTLLLLDLTSNNITDEGARALGEVLKYNRHLVYLNLLGNRISDAGASFILQYLQQFPLSFDDIIQKRRRRMNYLKSRSITYEKCLQEIKLARLESKSKKDFHTSGDHINQTLNVPCQIKHKKTKKHAIPSLTIEETTVEEDAQMKMKEIIGNFEDPFEEQYIKRKNGIVYCTGNFSFTALNLAYNNLSYLSVRKILHVLKYQSGVNKLIPNTGLVRVVIEGNKIPAQCSELREIDIILERAVLQHEHSFILNRNPPQHRV